MGFSSSTRLDQGPRKRDGFTLVELLVVMAVLAVVIGMLLPTIATTMASARALQCQSNVRVICQELLSYANVSRGRFPSNASAPAGSWWYQIREFTQLTPSAPNEFRGPVATCPEDAGAQRSYAMNVWASSQIDLSIRKDNPQTCGWDLTAKNASKLILVSEAWSSIGSDAGGWVSPGTLGLYGPTPGRRFGGSGGISYLAGRFKLVQSELDFSRHRLVSRSKSQADAMGRVVIGYADGHVMLRSNRDLVTPTGTSTLDSWWSPSDPQTNQ